MKIIFRTDGNSFIGMGHVMRCMSLAKALQQRSCECVFAVSDETCSSNIQSNGFTVYNLNSLWNQYEASTDKFVEFIHSMNPFMVVIDSYYYSDRFLEILCGHTKVAVITESLPGNFTMEVDYFINYNVFLNHVNDYPDSRKTKYMLGSKYALLRTEFEAVPIQNQNSRNSLAILTGGSDPYNIAPELCETILGDQRFENIALNVISSGLNPNISCLLALEKKVSRVLLTISPSSMRNEMVKSEVAISAGGSTLYELCACAIPAISFSYADNQLALVHYFDKIKMIPYSGDIRTARAETIKCMMNHLSVLLSDLQMRDTLKHKMRKLCDGRGAKRTASALIGREM